MLSPAHQKFFFGLVEMTVGLVHAMAIASVDGKLQN